MGILPYLCGMEDLEQRRTAQFNTLRSQIHTLQAREDEVRKFLRLLNKEEKSISPKYLDAFCRLCESFIPNG